MLNVPEWLQILVATQEFHTLCAHPNESDEARKRIFFCVSCCEGPFCMSEKTSKHDPSQDTVLKMWKQGENSVVRAKDIKNLLNLDDIKQYYHNGFRAVVIGERLEGVMGREWKCFCVFCGRQLSDECRFCSLFCKMKSIMDSPNTADTLMPSATKRDFLGRDFR